MMWPWKKKKPAAPEVKSPEFIIEHYPLANKWVARHRNNYIRIGYPSRAPELTQYQHHAELCNSEEGARKLIDKYREWHGKAVNYIVVA